MCFCFTMTTSVRVLWLMSGDPSPDPPPVYHVDSHVVLASTSLTPQTPEPSFELLVMLCQPTKCVHANRKTKNVKPKPENKGPFNIPVDIEWHAFLGTVAEKIFVNWSDLLVTSFEWHWLKPASSPWIPVQDETRFASMVKKIKLKKNNPNVILRMDAPSKNKLLASSRNGWDDMDDVESDVEDGLVSKKVRCIPYLSCHCIQLLAGKTG